MDEYKWTSSKPLPDELAGRIAAGSGIFIAIGCILFVLGYSMLSLLFMFVAVLSGCYFYVTSKGTVISITDNCLRYGNNTEIKLENINGVKIKRQFGISDVLVVLKEGSVGNVMPLKGVPPEERNKIIEVIQNKIKVS
ncbi:MAG: hypothetical protein ABW201_11820 [Candidatus Thiodiazotropha sp.]